MPSFLGPFTFDEYSTDEFLKSLNIASAQIDSTTMPGFLNLGDILPINSIVIGIAVKVLTAFDGNPSLSIGDTLFQSRWYETDGIDFSTPGVYEGNAFDPITVNTQARAYWNPGNSSIGSLITYILFSSS